MQPADDSRAGDVCVPKTPELLSIARRLVWWLPPKEALGEQRLFLARVMTLGTWDDVETVRAGLGEDALRETLNAPPAGIFDAPSWHYWHRRFGCDPIPPLPKRKLP
jgi:hypothetical protein